jgi:hypothetical protein
MNKPTDRTADIREWCERASKWDDPENPMGGFGPADLEVVIEDARWLLAQLKEAQERITILETLSGDDSLRRDNDALAKALERSEKAHAISAARLAALESAADEAGTADNYALIVLREEAKASLTTFAIALGKMQARAEQAESERDELRERNARITKALIEAACSLETLSKSNRDLGLDSLINIRGYAYSRATVARAALSDSTSQLVCPECKTPGCKLIHIPPFVDSTPPLSGERPDSVTAGTARETALSTVGENPAGGVFKPMKVVLDDKALKIISDEGLENRRVIESQMAEMNKSDKPMRYTHTLKTQGAPVHLASSDQKSLRRVVHLVLSGLALEGNGIDYDEEKARWSEDNDGDT